MKSVEKITKTSGLFTNYIYKAIPLAFDESMSYYETLCALLSYLKDTILPTLNNNADALVEVQNLMTTLQKYVDNYFNNLDVQEEINNKLDKLVEDGTLEKLINENILTDIKQEIEELNTNNNELKQGAYNTNTSTIHISFDDVNLCMQNLINNIYDSLFDEPLFSTLKFLHDTYNACFSLYVFTDTFNNIASTKYKDEFIKNSNWLKIGYHSKNLEDSIDNLSYREVLNRYNTFVTQALKICGTNNIIDRVPRLNYYKGNLWNIGGLIDANCGIIGLLDADDDRISYSHNNLEQTILNNKYEYFSNVINILFVKTITRLENISNVTTTLNTLMGSKYPIIRNIEIFTHENQLYNGSTITSSMLTKIQDVCKWANDNNIPFNFIQNKIENLTGKTLYDNFTQVKCLFNTKQFYKLLPKLLVNSINYEMKDMININKQGMITITDETNKFGLFGVLIIPHEYNQLKIQNIDLDSLQVAIAEFDGNIACPENLTENGLHAASWIDLPTNETTAIDLQDNTSMIELMFKNNGSTTYNEYQKQTINIAFGTHE